MSICGKNTMTEPTPPITPSISMSFSGPSGIHSPMKSPKSDTPASIQSMGYCPSTKVTSNMRNSRAKKMGNPSQRLAMRASRWCVTL